MSGAKGRQFRLLGPHGRHVGIHASNRRIKPDGLTDFQTLEQAQLEVSLSTLYAYVDARGLPRPRASALLAKRPGKPAKA